ncbi:MAG: hypothetical protein IJ093_01475 [Bacilli bacterium]|nr:hypothetical protein [Bacilli bacterium]
MIKNAENLKEVRMPGWRKVLTSDFDYGKYLEDYLKMVSEGSDDKELINFAEGIDGREYKKSSDISVMYPSFKASRYEINEVYAEIMDTLQKKYAYNLLKTNKYMDTFNECITKTMKVVTSFYVDNINYLYEKYDFIPEPGTAENMDEAVTLDTESLICDINSCYLTDLTLIDLDDMNTYIMDPIPEIIYNYEDYTYGMPFSKVYRR